MQPCPCYRAVLERCSSGLRGTPGKRVYSKRVSGVRISFSPQNEKENQRQVHLNADFLFPVCTAPPQAAGDVGAPANEIPERRRRAGPPTGDDEAPANEISERRRCAGPPTGDIGATEDEISERRRCAGPPTGDVGATADEISERRRRAGPPTGDVRATADEIPERRRRAGPPADSADHLMTTC